MEGVASTYWGIDGMCRFWTFWRTEVQGEGAPRRGEGDARKPELQPKTRADYEWALSNHLLPWFADHPLSEITVADVDRYRAAKVREREAIEAAHRRGERLRERGLSAGSINKTLVRLASILELAVEYGLIDRNPAKGQRRRLKAAKPERPWLDRADHITALLDAAGAVDAESRTLHQRRPSLAVLIFSGLRVGELLALRWRDVDLAGGKLRVADAKTPASVRQVDLLPVLRDELVEYRAGANPDGLVFPTSTGRAHSADNLRDRLFGKSVDRANQRLTGEGLAPLPSRLTPQLCGGRSLRC